MAGAIKVRHLGLADYRSTLAKMCEFTDARTPATPDEIWLLQHPPVFTLGLNADPSHVLAADEIPVVQVDRGGQVTYHGPGQLVAYTLLDLRRADLGIRDLVTVLENAMTETVASYGIDAVSRRDAPGIYADGRKLGSVGLRVRRGCSYHGLALNVTMDLSPFKRINPCGFPDLQVTDLAKLGGPNDLEEVASVLTEKLINQLALKAAA